MYRLFGIYTTSPLLFMYWYGLMIIFVYFMRKKLHKYSGKHHKFDTVLGCRKMVLKLGYKGVTVI